jgi:hypothetical protein
MKNIIQIIGIFVLASCASPQSPTGGEKDINSPTLYLDSSIFKSNSNPKVLNFTFNENVTINKNRIEINPKIETEPTFNIKNKSFSIELPIPLKQNTTYSIRLNDAVKDVNEGNVGQYPTLLFSTGNTIDSNFLHLNIFGKPKDKELTIFVIKDSIKYSYKTKDNELSILSSPEASNITCFIDQNNNAIFDPLETGTIENRYDDTIPLVLVSANNFLVKQLKIGSQTLIYNLPIQEFKNSKALKFKDTIIFSNLSDTLFSRYTTLSSSIEKKPNYLSYGVISRRLKDSNSFIIEFNQVIELLENNNIIFRIGNDTITNAIIKQVKKNQIQINNQTSFKNAELNILANSIKFQDSINRPIKLLISPSELALIEFVNTKGNTLSVIIKDKNLAIIDVFTLQINDKIRLELKPGEYTATTFIDLDNNGYLNHPLENGPRETAKTIENIIVNAKLLNIIKL